MKQGWELKKLKEIGTAQTGTTPKTSEKENFGNFIPFIKPADVNFLGRGDIRYENAGLSEIGLKKGRKMDRGSILMVCIGATIGKVGFTEMDVSCNQQINSLTVGKNFDPKFIYYAMTSKDFQDKVLLEGRGAQATLPIINKSKWENIKISYPKSLQEQQRIVAILDEAFSAIAKAKSNAEQNLKNAKELFESYLQNVFESEKRISDEKPLGGLCKNITVGFVGKMADKYKETGIIFLRSQNIKPHKIELKDVVFIDEIFNSEIKKSQLLPGDLVIVRTGYPGTAAVIPKSLPVSNCSDIVIVKVGDKMDPFFLCYFFNSTYGKKLVLGNIVGAAQKHFNVGAAKKVKVPVPNIKKQQKLVKLLDEISIETKKLEAIYQQKLDDLEELKKSVLQKAFNGELKTEKEVNFIK